MNSESQGDTLIIRKYKESDITTNLHDQIWVLLSHIVLEYANRNYNLHKLSCLERESYYALGSLRYKK